MDSTDKKTGDEIASWEYEVESTLCTLSDGYYRMLGYEPGEFEGNFANLFSLLHPDDIAHTTEIFDELFLGKRRYYINEVRLLNKSGSYTRVRSVGHAERDKAGFLVRFVGWNTIITGS